LEEVGGTSSTQVEEVIQHDEVGDVALTQGAEMTRKREEEEVEAASSKKARIDTPSEQQTAGKC